MKGMCIGESQGVYEFTFEGNKPDPGLTYLLESAVDGTLAQNALFHALVTEYWKSGLSSYHDDEYAAFRDQIKLKLGKGFEAFIYIEYDEKAGKAYFKDAKTYNDIPEYIIEDPELKKLARGRLRSWTSYTNKMRRETIDKLILEMLSIGVNSKKFNDILKEIKYEIV